MITQDYIPTELVERLKKAGFENETKTYFGVIIIRPTIWQVLKWLREEKKIHIIVEIADCGWYECFCCFMDTRDYESGYPPASVKCWMPIVVPEN